MKYQLKRAQQLHCNVETAWNFFSSPHNLAKITPPDMNFIVHTKFENFSLHEGMEIDYTVSPLLGIPLKWKTVIAHVDFQKSFTDIQRKGPYKLWNHHHEFLPNEQGVLMKDTVDYQLPFGIFGVIAHRLLVYKKLNHIFDYRCKVLDKLFNQSV